MKNEVLLTRESVNEWLEYRKNNKLPHPPLAFIKCAYIWILAQFHQDSDSIVFPDQRIMQWSPTELTWYQVGDLASVEKAISMQGYHVVSQFEFVELPAYDKLIEENEKRKAY